MREIRKGKLFNRKVLGKNKIYLIDHAIRRMKERGITLDEIVEVLNHPDEERNAEPPRIKLSKQRDRHTAVDVVYEVRSDTIRVITTMTRHLGSGFRVGRLQQRNTRRGK